MSFYANLRTSALATLTKFGKSITFSRTVSGGYDPATGGTTGDTTETATGVGVLVNYKNIEIDGTTILASDRKIIYSGEEPQINDSYSSWRVVAVNPIDPDESGNIVYICQVRK